MDIYEWLKEKDNTDLNTKPGEYDSFQIKTPTLVVFGSEQDGYENNQVIKVLENITTMSSSGKDTTIDTLRKFFTGVNIGNYKEPFPWWAWALCIGGGVGAVFAIFLVIKKNKKH